MRALNRKQLRVARSMAEVLFDDGSGVPAERLDYTMEELADFSGRMGWQSRLALGAALLILSVAPFLLWFQWKRFASLPSARRAACVLSLEVSKLGMVVVLLKTVLSMVYFEHPDALAATGYDAEGLLGPAYAPGSPSPISKLRVLPGEPAAAPDAAGTPALTPAAGRGAAGGA